VREAVALFGCDGMNEMQQERGEEQKDSGEGK